MTTNLTKDARWVLLWAETLSDTPLAKPHQMVYNTGRHKYGVPSIKAINDTLDFGRDKVLRSVVYEVDVALFPYAKQWKEVSDMAEKYFKRRLATPSNKKEDV